MKVLKLEKLAVTEMNTNDMKKENGGSGNSVDMKKWLKNYMMNKFLKKQSQQ